MLTAGTHFCERQENIEENKNVDIVGEKEKVERRHRISDVPFFSPFPVHRKKKRVAKQVN